VFNNTSGQQSIEPIEVWLQSNVRVRSAISPVPKTLLAPPSTEREGAASLFFSGAVVT
jgi:hypothetical protein